MGAKRSKSLVIVHFNIQFSGNGKLFHEVSNIFRNLNLFQFTYFLEMHFRSGFFLKETNFQKLWFSTPYIFATQCCRPLILQTMTSFKGLHHHGLQRHMEKKFEFVLLQIVSHLQYSASLENTLERINFFYLKKKFIH